MNEDKWVFSALVTFAVLRLTTTVLNAWLVYNSMIGWLKLPLTFDSVLVMTASISVVITDLILIGLAIYFALQKWEIIRAEKLINRRNA